MLQSKPQEQNMCLDTLEVWRSRMKWQNRTQRDVIFEPSSDKHKQL